MLDSPDFVPFHAHPLDTGDDICIEKQSWDCVEPCIVIGHIHGVAVLQIPGGPQLNSTQLVARGTLKTRGRKGQMPIEVTALGAYVQIRMEDSVGKTVKAVKTFDCSVAVVFDDNSYYKVRAGSDYDGPSLNSEYLTIQDLYGMDLITEDTYNIYHDQKKSREKVGKIRDGKRNLQYAVNALGPDMIRYLLEGYQA